MANGNETSTATCARDLGRIEAISEKHAGEERTMSHHPRILAICCALLLTFMAESAERRWTVTGQEVPELAAIDQMVHGQMLEFDIRAASVAIAKDGRLVYARGYTWDDADVEPVQPTTLFRTGSIGKAITSIAVHQLIERGLLDYATLVASTLGLQPLPGEQTDPRLAGVTLDHLLTHTSGLSSVDNIYEVAELVTEAVGAGPPTKQEIIAYIIGQPFVFDSGTAWDYNNYGYMMLDQLVQRATGESYAEYVVDQIFHQVGVGRARVAHQLATERFPTETTYHGLEGDAYGVPLEHAVAAGGWVMAAPDMARLFSALFDFDNAEGLLEQTTIDTMLSAPYPVSAELGYGRGWINEDFFIGSGHTVGWLTDPDDGLQVYGHGGGGTGVHTLAVWRSDGIVFVWFTNKDPVVQNFDDLPRITSWPEHDLWESVGISTEPIGSAPAESWVPVVAHSEGVGNSVWRTDVGLLNRSPLTNQIQVRFHRRNRTHDQELQLVPGEYRALSDVVGGFSTSGSGPLQVFSSEPLIVTSRTYSQTPTGTFGQSLDGVTVTGGLEAGESTVLMHLREDGSARSNIGILNQWRRSAEVKITLYEGDGSLVASFTQRVPSQDTVQVNRPFLTVGERSDVGSGYAVVSVMSGQDVYVYGSVVDNVTDDPTTIPMKVGVGTDHQWIAAAASAEGAYDSRWRTDLCLLNRSNGAVSIDVIFHADDGGRGTMAIELDSNEQRTVEDVVSAIGMAGTGSIEIVSDRPVLVASRTYNASPAGTFGQYLDGNPAGRAAGAGQTVWLPQLRQNATFRSNIGILNAGPEDAEVTVRLFDEGGVELAERQRRIGRGERLQLQEPLDRIAGRGDLDSAYATVTVVSGSGVIAYASVIDNATNDPSTIPMKW